MDTYTGFAIGALLSKEVFAFKRAFQARIHSNHKVNHRASGYLPHVTAVREIPSWKLLQFISQLPTQKLDVGITELKILRPQGRDFDVLAFDVVSSEIESLNHELSGYLKSQQKFEFVPHLTIDFLKKDCSGWYEKGSQLYTNTSVFDRIEIPRGLETKGWVLYTPQGEEIPLSVYNDNEALIQYVEMAA